MATKLFVGGLSWDTTEESLRNFFAPVGQVTSVSIITDKYTGKSKGFGFVEMSTPEEAGKAIQQLNGQQLDGRAVAVNEARPREDRPNRGFGGGGGGGFNRGGRDGGRDRDRGGRNW